MVFGGVSRGLNRQNRHLTRRTQQCGTTFHRKPTRTVWRGYYLAQGAFSAFGREIAEEIVIPTRLHARFSLTGRIIIQAVVVAMLALAVPAPAGEPTIELTAGQRAWLTEHPVLRVSADPGFAPVEFVDQQGQFRGYAADMLELVADRLGVRFEYVSAPNWSEALRMARRREVDVLTATAPTPERLEYLRFSDPIANLPAAIITKRDGSHGLTLADLEGKRVAVVADYAAVSHIHAKHPAIRIVTVTSIVEGLAEVAFGHVEAFVGTLMTATHQIESLGVANLQVAGDTGYVYDLGIAVRRDWPELVPILNKALADIGDEQRADVYARWLNLQQPNLFQTRSFWIGVSVVVLVLAGGAAGLWAWRSSLRRMVVSRTRALHEELRERRRAEAERGRLEAQLLQSQKMEAVGQLAGGVAHDFNNLLTAILGNVELTLAEVGDRLPTDSLLVDGLRQIEQAAERAAGLTRQLLTFSRRQVSRPQVLDLNRTLREMEKMLRRLVTENIELEVSGDPDIPTVCVDPGQIEQVIMNLVVNARDAMPGGGKLSLTTNGVILTDDYAGAYIDTKPGPHVILSVSDTGCGMDRTTLARIFEPFYTTKDVGRGTGLGLSTAYGIIKQSGGNIKVYSEPGIGTTFRIYLPAADESAEAAGAVTKAERQVPTGTESILVCEDDHAVRELTVKILREAGYSVISAEGPTTAIELIAQQESPLQLLITDVIMPDADGRELSDALTAARPDLRTLFISGYTADVITHHGVLQEGVEFLEKPFTRRDLLLRVRDLLDSGERVAAPPADRR